MRWLLLIPVLLVALIAFEAWRLSRTASVRLQLTYDFVTPEGPRTASTVIEERQRPAIPYLPGGEVGRATQVGDAAVAELPGGPAYMPLYDTRWFLRYGVENGGATPPIRIDDIRQRLAFRTEFFERLRSAGSTIVVDVAGMPPDLRKLINVVTLADPRDPATLEYRPLPEFEAAQPGIRLVRVTLNVTDAAVTRQLDARLSWLRDPPGPMPGKRGALRELPE